jgi:histidine triad (HIT) family protein
MPAEAYDDQNIFARILRGEIPCHKVYEDEATIAFMDLMPQVDGHVLVVPKAASRNIRDAGIAELTATLATAQRLARAAFAAFDADGVTVQHFAEPAGGQSVFHTHFHVLPRTDGDRIRGHAAAMADQAVLKAHADKWRAALGAAD